MYGYQMQTQVKAYLHVYVTRIVLSVNFLAEFEKSHAQKFYGADTYHWNLRATIGWSYFALSTTFYSVRKQKELIFQYLGLLVMVKIQVDTSWL